MNTPQDSRLEMGKIKQKKCVVRKRDWAKKLVLKLEFALNRYSFNFTLVSVSVMYNEDI